MGTFGLIITIMATIAVLFQLWRVLGVHDETPTQTSAPKPSHLSLVHSSSTSNTLTESEQAAFLQGAKQAYLALIEALFKHDLSSCMSWLDTSVKQQFLAQIEAQEASGRTVTLHNNTIKNTNIVQQGVNNGMLEVIVRYDTNMDYTLHQPNTPDERIAQDVIYTWTFTRPANGANNAWKISSVDSVARS